MSAIVLVAGGVYFLAVENIFHVLLGMSLIFDEFLKGKWKHICCAVARVLATGILILEEINSDKPHAVEREMGFEQAVLNNTTLFSG